MGVLKNACVHVVHIIYNIYHIFLDITALTWQISSFTYMYLRTQLWGSECDFNNIFVWATILPTFLHSYMYIKLDTLISKAFTIFTSLQYCTFFTHNCPIDLDLCVYMTLLLKVFRDVCTSLYEQVNKLWGEAGVRLNPTNLLWIHHCTMLELWSYVTLYAAEWIYMYIYLIMTVLTFNY